MSKIILIAASFIAMTLGFQSNAISQTSSLTAPEAQFSEAMELFRNSDFSKAHELLDRFIDQRLTAPEWKNAPVDDSWIEALKADAECCLQLEEYQRAITIYDNLERLDASDAQIASNRGLCYQAIGQWIPALDNYRLAQQREPDELLHRLVLAKALVTAPHASLRDSKEAASLLKGLKQPLPNTAAVLEIQAALSAEDGDFDQAVKIQSQAVSLEREKDSKELANGILNLYQRRIRFPFIDEEAEPMTELERTQAISAGTVMVRVRGRVSYSLDDQTGSAPRVIENQHAGIVLNDRGDILITCTSLSIPYTVEPTWNSVDGAEWIEGPFIEVYQSTPSPQGAETFGRAEVKAIDEATGLALIRLTEYPRRETRRKLIPLRLNPTYVPDNTEDVIENGLTVQLNVWSPRQPENHLEVLVEEKPFGEIRFQSFLRKLEVHPNQRITTQNRWNAPQSRRVGSWSRLKTTDLTVGAPIVNASGDCIAMVDRLNGENGLFEIGISADVISRVGAKLLSFGSVERAVVPVKVTAVELEQFSGKIDEENEPPIRSLKGMEIYETNGSPAVPSDITGLIITHVNQDATPHDMAWEAALEKAARRGLTSLTCTVFDFRRSESKRIEIPIQAPK